MPLTTLWRLSSTSTTCDATWASGSTSTKHVARDLAVELARVHLRRGHDVVVPQYVGRREFVERLHALADEVGTPFVEVVVTDDDEQIVARFRARRAAFMSSGFQHPEADLADEAVVDEIRAANAALRSNAVSHGLPLIEVSDGIDAAYRRLCDALAIP